MRFDPTDLADESVAVCRLNFADRDIDVENQLVLHLQRESSARRDMWQPIGQGETNAGIVVLHSRRYFAMRHATLLMGEAVFWGEKQRFFEDLFAATDLRSALCSKALLRRRRQGIQRLLWGFRVD